MTKNKYIIVIILFALILLVIKSNIYTIGYFSIEKDNTKELIKTYSKLIYYKHLLKYESNSSSDTIKLISKYIHSNCQDSIWFFDIGWLIKNLKIGQSYYSNLGEGNKSFIIPLRNYDTVINKAHFLNCVSFSIFYPLDSINQFDLNTRKVDYCFKKNILIKNYLYYDNRIIYRQNLDSVTSKLIILANEIF